MDFNESGLAQVKEESDAISEVINAKDIKTEIVKKELREVDFVKCETCKEHSDNEIECVHLQNVEIDISEHKQDYKLQVPSLHSSDDLHINSSNKDVKPKVEPRECSSAQEQDEASELIHAGARVKDEEYLDSPEYLSTNMDFVECGTGQIKTEDEVDIFCESLKTESVKEEPSDNEDSMNSDILGQDEGSSEDIRPGTSGESQKDCENEAKFQYQDYSNSFSSNSCLAQHKLSSTGGKPERSKKASTRFSAARYEDYLTGEHLTEEKQLICKFCSKPFDCKSKVTRHERYHTKSIHCQVCSKSFSQPSHLVIHERTHTGEKPFGCKVCSNYFSSKRSLRRHEKAHRGEKPFICKYCSKYFIQSECLARHERTHNGEKAFKCKICSKSFSRQSYVRDHENVHTREKSFDCEECFRPFSNRSSLSTHKKRIHRKDS